MFGLRSAGLRTCQPRRRPKRLYDIRSALQFLHIGDGRLDTSECYLLPSIAKLVCHSSSVELPRNSKCVPKTRGMSAVPLVSVRHCKLETSDEAATRRS